MHEEIFERIREECRIRNHSEGSCKQYVYHVSCFLKWIGDKPLDKLTLEDARNYILYKRDTTCIPATCNGINSALSAHLLCLSSMIIAGRSGTLSATLSSDEFKFYQIPKTV
ncbi:MAG: phage integrase N-terminal SAM-like domain-containing protein [Lachnospiraceae bacterium]|nr:phage integrase N-terminal SAM-like domain-containing protein [Lachnospiraceae bacterium]